MQEDIVPININVNKASVDGKVYDVLTYDEFVENYEYNKERSDIAVQINQGDVEYVLPYRGKRVHYNPEYAIPGIYNAGSINFIKLPEEKESDRYIPEQIISFSNSNDIRDILAKAEAARKLDEPYLTSADHITTVNISDDDQPEMRCLKMAINAKKIDLDKYAGRFGDNFPNDKRQLKSNAVTLNIIKRYCENCDMEAILTLKDTSPDIPNPMGREISVSLTDINSILNEEEQIDDEDSLEYNSEGV